MNCKYRLRWFSSKGAFLVLMWILLLTIASISFTYSFKKSLHLALSDYPAISKNWLGLIPLSAAMFIAPLSGWLADAKFGNFRVFRAGTVLLFMSTMTNCLFLIIIEFVSDLEDYKMLRLVLISLTASMFGIGACACAVTSLPLCLNQMPDASSSNITSVIAWFVFILFIGEFLSRFIVTLEENCLLDGTMLSNYALIVALISSLCMSSILISNFLFHPIWLIIEPQSPKSLKTIYQVLKFAAKHKAPLDRSAFTYWENDIPSRIDLGKSKYGGPFTTEQVEDVKTILRLLVIGITFSLVIMSITWETNAKIIPGIVFPGLNSCTTNVVYLFTYHCSCWSILGALLNEFAIYPLFKNRLPNTLKKIGGVSLMITIISFICLILELAHYLSHSNETATEWIISVFYQSTNGLLLQVLITSVLEFLCAQTPYNMRCLFLSFAIPVAFLAGEAGWNIGYVLFTKICPQSWCSTVSFSVKTLLCLIAFIVYCAAARWYKMRVRDNEYDLHREVAEVYDRYLTAAVAQSSAYRTRNKVPSVNEH